nr:DNA mismatch repair endonuclease MutL [Eubacterium sp.]
MIKVLDQHTIDKIAAGEVIERPASVVKELVENSIDSKATRITVEINDGGTSMIRVTDNGCGIEADDVRKAYLSHATSKLDNIDDLLSISSLGFRGEALSTIAAVSKVEMVTKTRESLTGIRYEIQGGKEIDLKEVGAPDGTTIIARELFFNTPARLKFLKSNMTEGSYINDLMSHIALANPDVKIKLISNGKTIIDSPGDGRLKETIYSLYGKEITKGLLEVEYDNGDDIKVTGYIGKPYLSKGNRSFENYFVNKRYIKSPIVNRAIEEAYKTHIMQHKFPFTALFLELPPYMVDVNVHPAKREFRFDNEKALFSAVFHAVAEALKGKEMIPDADADYGVKQKIYTPLPPEKIVSSRPISPGLSNQEIHSLFSMGSRTSMNPVRDKHPTSSDESSILGDHKKDNIIKNNDMDQVEDNVGPSSYKTSNNSDAGYGASRSTQSSSQIHKNNAAAGFGILDSLLPEEYRDKLSEITSQGNNTQCSNNSINNSFNTNVITPDNNRSDNIDKSNNI